MVLSHKCCCRPCLIILRNIYLHSVLECNHYKALGLSSSATQAEIKSAYYELSKKHHPDMNQGSEKSTKKFRDISAAYEILGNEKLRKQYDREQQLVGDRGKDFRQTSSRTDYNDEFERMYYERKNRSSSKYGYGKTKYYDFDTWYKSHYVDYKNESYYRNNFRTSRSRMYQDPYYRKSSDYDNFKKAHNSAMHYFFFCFLSSFMIYFWLRTGVV